MADDSEIRAREIGWVPKEEFKGDPEKWVDANTFVERGEIVLPILRAKNQELHTSLTQVNQKLTSVEQALKDSQDTIKALEEYHQEDLKQKVEDARVKLKAELVAAKREGNVEGEVEIQDQLIKLDGAERARVEAVAKEKIDNGTASGDNTNNAPDPTKHPEFIAWRSENPWFGTDYRRTALAEGIAAELIQKGEKLRGRDFLNKVVKEVDAVLNPRPGTSKVEGGGGGASGRVVGNGKTYNDLPADAKAQCDKFAPRLVGPNRLHKDMASWQASYANQYFAQEEGPVQ